MSNAEKRPWAEMHTRAAMIVDQLKPHCRRVEIAGSIRRKVEYCGDVEIVADPNPYDVGLFASGLATVVDQWEKVKGELPCKYTQRIIPGGVKLDFFVADKTNFGLILAIRTGPAEFSKNLMFRLKQNGYRIDEGRIWSGSVVIPTPEEIDVFNRARLPWIDPEKRF